MKQVHELLKHADLKITRQREAILSLFLDEEQGFTAEELYQKLLQNGTPLPLSTVYRTLHTLTEHHLLERTDLPGSSSSTFYLAKDGHSHHLTCVRCKKCIVLEDCPLDEYARAFGEHSGYRITGHSLEMFGVCPSCQKND